MKRFVCALVLATMCQNSFAVASFLAGLEDKTLALGGLLTTTTTSVTSGFLVGLVVFADNGEAHINLGSEAAQEALKVAVQKHMDGEELSAEDQAMISIYAQGMGMTEAQVIEGVAAEL